jgi:hypothetical protein
MPARRGHIVVVRRRNNPDDGEGSRRRIMAARISHDRRLLGFDPLEWLMLVAAVLLLGFVALAV